MKQSNKHVDRVIRRRRYSAIHAAWKVRQTLVVIIACLPLLWQPYTILAQQKVPLPSTNEIRQRERISLNEDWRFMRFEKNADPFMYDVRPEVKDRNDNIVADTRPTEAVKVVSSEGVLKKWILPTANPFIKDSAKHYQRPVGDPGKDFSFVQPEFEDQDWRHVDLPHDWAIAGPFYQGPHAEVGGGMGRLPIQGVGWYRKKIFIPPVDKERQVFLDIDGSMSYTMVWINGQLAGGWPYGYNSFRIDLTPYIRINDTNQLAIRIDNPNHSARWYPGAGIYRNVWLTKVSAVHLVQWGPFVSSRNVSRDAATLDLVADIANNSAIDQAVEISSTLYLKGNDAAQARKEVAGFPRRKMVISAGSQVQLLNTLDIKSPVLWGPPPDQRPNMYICITRLFANGKMIDVYETAFGIRSLVFDPEKGLLVNDKPVRIKGVNQHHDLGALGTAFNTRAAQRQLEILRDMGCNAIRMAHNPPAPELLDLTDKMGFLVIDEIFDNWERKKTPLDFHLIFPEWYEADTRAFIRRDRNHPSVIAWSFGNEVGEQYTADTGALLAKKLYDIVKDEDPTRPATASMNYAKPDMPFPAVMDILSLNYQGEGIRDAPAYAHLKGIRTSPLYPAFRDKFPGKLIVSSETSSALSTRGTYIFPVTTGFSAPVSDSTGGDPLRQQVSAYELYTAAFGASPDKVFASQDKHPYVAGEFIWSGWDYLGEPTPYYTARSSYSGVIDLAGFRKDRFYLYQSRWRPELPMAHILPHWNWTGREGEIIPVHVFSSGDGAELFLNGHSLGKKRKGDFEYRFRWDSVRYEPGELTVVVSKQGKPWAKAVKRTTGPATRMSMKADRTIIESDGRDLSFVTVSVTDSKGAVVPTAANRLHFSIEGPGEIVATDNGDPANLESFVSRERAAYSGLALVIVRSLKGKPGTIKVIANAEDLKPASILITGKK